jgi:hypothetical protein
MSTRKVAGDELSVHRIRDDVRVLHMVIGPATRNASALDNTDCATCLEIPANESPLARRVGNEGG